MSLRRSFRNWRFPSKKSHLIEAKKSVSTDLVANAKQRDCRSMSVFAIERFVQGHYPGELYKMKLRYYDKDEKTVLLYEIFSSTRLRRRSKRGQANGTEEDAYKMIEMVCRSNFFRVCSTIKQRERRSNVGPGIWTNKRNEYSTSKERCLKLRVERSPGKNEVLGLGPEGSN